MSHIERLEKSLQERERKAAARLARIDDLESTEIYYEPAPRRLDRSAYTYSGVSISCSAWLASAAAWVRPSD